MVAPISVFPNVGNAFFGSMREARQSRLQEAAMRAEMAAAQAERQRQAQARDSYARLMQPDRMEAIDLDPVQQAFNDIGGRLEGAGIVGRADRYATERAVPALNQEQRAREMTRLAQASPEMHSALMQSQAGPEVDIPQGAMEAIGQAVVRGDITPGGAVARLVNFGLTEQQAVAQLSIYAVPGERSPVRGVRIETDEGQMLVDPTTGEPIAEYGPRPNRATQINLPADPANVQLLSDEQVATYGLDPSVPYEFYRDAQGNTRVRPVTVPGRASANEEDDVDLDDLSRATLQSYQFSDSQYQDLEQLIDIVENRGAAAVGLGALSNVVPGTPAAEVAALLDSVTGAVALERLEQMRDMAAASGNRGSGLGQVTEREIAILRAARGALSQNLSPERFLANANRLLTQLAEVRAERDRILQANFPEVYNRVQSRSGAPVSGGDAEPTEDDGYEDF